MKKAEFLKLNGDRQYRIMRGLWEAGRRKDYAIVCGWYKEAQELTIADIEEVFGVEEEIVKPVVIRNAIWNLGHPQIGVGEYQLNKFPSDLYPIEIEKPDMVAGKYYYSKEKTRKHKTQMVGEKKQVKVFVIPVSELSPLAS